MKKLYPLADLPKEPDARRQLLLRVKAKAKKAGFPVKVWLDAAGLHVEGSVVMFRAIERET